MSDDPVEVAARKLHDQLIEWCRGMDGATFDAYDSESVHAFVGQCCAAKNTVETPDDISVTLSEWMQALDAAGYKRPEDR